MTFGDKLSRLRKEKNLTQEQLADILNVSRQSVSKWESNVSYPETDKLIVLSELFVCSTDYLLKDDCISKDEHISKRTSPVTAFHTNHQKIIGYVLLTVSLLCGILILLLAKSEESLLLSLILTVILFACSLICLFVKQNAAYWCVWSGFAPFIFLSPYLVGISFLFGINISLLAFYVIMFFVAKKYFNVSIIISRKKSILLILGWILFVGLNLILYCLPFFNIGGLAINPVFHTQMSAISYIIIAFLLTYTACYIKNIVKRKQQ